MKRDFSEQEKQKLLSMVRDVENEKICDFTDWIGDKGLEISQWIGLLDINRYLKNVDEYHRKMIDMNNTSDASIKKVFDEVYEVDHHRAVNLRRIEEKYEALYGLILNLCGTMDTSRTPFSYDRVAALVKSVSSIDIVGGYDLLYVDDEGNVQVDWDKVAVIFTNYYLLEEDIEKLIELFDYMETVDETTYAKMLQKLIEAGYTDEDVRQIEEYLKKRDLVIKRPKTFDENDARASYGGDQGDMAFNHKGDKELYIFIKQYDKYKDYSDEQIDKLLDEINSEGCGYVSMVNNIFVEFEGREEEFAKRFGFPMYDRNGYPNYNYLLIDLYSSADDLYFIDDPMGATALVNDIINEYRDRETGGWNVEAFRRKYGCDPIIGNNTINPIARQRILDEYGDISVAHFKSGGVTAYSHENRFIHYMNEKGIPCSLETYAGDSIPSNEDIKKLISQGKNVNIEAFDFNLYDENGNTKKEHLEGHTMTVTGITEDGRYIVSSWGDLFYLKPEELDGPILVVTDITP